MMPGIREKPGSGMIGRMSMRKGPGIGIRADDFLKRCGYVKEFML